MPKSDIATISPLLLLTGLLVPAFASRYVTASKKLFSTSLEKCLINVAFLTSFVLILFCNFVKQDRWTHFYSDLV